MNNCKNCGAPPDGSGRCPYCGTSTDAQNQRVESYIEISAEAIRFGVIPALDEERLMKLRRINNGEII